MKTQDAIYFDEERPFIKARGLGLKTMIGAPYSNVNLTIPPDSLAMIYGDHGSGKTPLLLTLAGRMVSTKGELEVAGYELPKERHRVAKIAGLGLFTGLNDLEENLPASLILRSELELYGKPHRKVAVVDYFAKWGLSHIQNMLVRDLSQPDLVRFGIALGMVNDPQLLVVDDVQDQLTLEQIGEIVTLLKSLAHDGHKVVVMGCTEGSITHSADYLYKLEQDDTHGM